MTFVFVHIPKTAGTSFRYALEKARPGEVLYDYGDRGLATPFIHEQVFAAQGPFQERIARVAAEVRRLNPLALAGHFPASRYWGHFPANDFITSLRDPEKRALSHFDHHLSYLTKEHTLEQFLQGEGTNLQSKLLADVDLDAFGLIGITEHYKASLRLMERDLGLKVRALRRNTRLSPWRWLARKRPPARRTAEFLERIREANLEDRKLYDELLARFRARYKQAFGSEPS